MMRSGRVIPRSRNKNQDIEKLKTEYWQKPKSLREVSKRWRERESWVSSWSSSSWVDGSKRGILVWAVAVSCACAGGAAMERKRVAEKRGFELSSCSVFPLK